MKTHTKKKIDSICTVDCCGRPVLVKKFGLCENHYRRMKRNGSPDIHWNKPWGNAKTVRADGYIYITRDGKQVMEHRWNVEQALKRKLRADEIIHHKDGDKTNNNLDNLVVTNRRDHKKFHTGKLPITQDPIYVCGLYKKHEESYKKED